LEDANLQNASFKNSSLELVSFDGSDLRMAVFDHAWIAGSTFTSTCVSNASFIGARFAESLSISNQPALREETDQLGFRTPNVTFYGAKGQGVDFRGARELWQVRLGSDVTKALFDGADGRPKPTEDVLDEDAKARRGPWQTRCR
jgi:uncharacterized protein YjbI with pentapeptide repeats